MAKFNESEKAIQSLNEELEKLRKQTKAVADENIRLNDIIKKQSTSVDDLKNKNKQLDTTQEELIKLDKQMSVVEAKLTNEYLQVKKAVIQKQEAEKKANEEIKRSLGISKQAQQEEKKLASERAKAAKEKEKQDRIAFKNSKEGIRQMLIEKQAKQQLTDEVKKSLGIQNRFVGGIKAGITQFALMATAALGTIKVIQKFGKALINSSQSLSDEWAVKTEQARAATNLFLKSLASGNFDDFFGRLKDVTDQARKYAEAIDRLTDLNRSLDIQEAEVKDRLVELQIASRDVTKSYEERQKAINEIIAIETDLASKKKEYTTEEKNQLLANIAMQTGISEQKIETYIREYQSIDDLLNKGSEYKAALMDLEKQQAAGSDVATRAIAAAFNRKKIDEAKQALQAFGDEYKVGFGLLQMYGSLNDEEMEKLKQAYINVAQANSQFNENTRRAQTLQNTLTEQQKNDFIKAEKEKQKAVENRIAAEGKALREIDAASAESARDSAQLEQDINESFAQNEIDLNKNLNEILLDDKKSLSEKLLEIEKWLTGEIEGQHEKRKEDALKYADAALSSAQELANAIGDYQQTKYDNEISRIENKKQFEIDMAEKSGKDTTDIEKKYDKQIRKVQYAQAVSAKKTAKFNAIISGANAVLNALKVEPFPLGLILSIVAGTLTGIQIAKINKEPLPQAFRHGTKGALKEGVYATISEDGSEYFKNKKLGIEGLTPKFETKAFIPEGTEIFPVYSKETKEAKERVSNDGTLTELRQIRKALSEKREKDIVTRQGAFHIIEQNNQRTISRKRLIN